MGAVSRQGVACTLVKRTIAALALAAATALGFVVFTLADATAWDCTKYPTKPPCVTTTTEGTTTTTPSTSTTTPSTSTTTTSTSTTTTVPDVTVPPPFTERFQRPPRQPKLTG